MLRWPKCAQVLPKICSPRPSSPAGILCIKGTLYWSFDKVYGKRISQIIFLRYALCTLSRLRNELIKSLENALASPTIPSDVVASILNLAEFMEHDENPLPVDIATLGAVAENCHAFAKALHYKELEFKRNPKVAKQCAVFIQRTVFISETFFAGLIVFAGLNCSRGSHFN